MTFIAFQSGYTAHTYITDTALAFIISNAFCAVIFLVCSCVASTTTTAIWTFYLPGGSIVLAYDQKIFILALIATGLRFSIQAYAAQASVGACDFLSGFILLTFEQYLIILARIAARIDSICFASVRCASKITVNIPGRSIRLTLAQRFIVPAGICAYFPAAAPALVAFAAIIAGNFIYRSVRLTLAQRTVILALIGTDIFVDAISVHAFLGIAAFIAAHAAVVVVESDINAFTAVELPIARTIAACPYLVHILNGKTGRTLGTIPIAITLDIHLWFRIIEDARRKLPPEAVVAIHLAFMPAVIDIIQVTAHQPHQSEYGKTKGSRFHSLFLRIKYLRRIAAAMNNATQTIYRCAVTHSLYHV